MSMLNWHRDPGYEQRVMQHEQRMSDNLIAIERSKERTKQIESEILRVRNDSELIEKETEQMRQETAKLRLLNAKTRCLISCVDQLCFPPESSSISQIPTAPDCKPS